ncbi:hypothetical protein VKT23_008787 [Stygiomarasmius scandens]|uniref:BHLH domain-containing protein n=1 Tax=Marasmiellus scandens TaxID=2682957 RepID=A0ABR1JKV3_9AGAR
MQPLQSDDYPCFRSSQSPTLALICSNMPATPSSSTKDLYAASCNPSRRAKVPRRSTSMATTETVTSSSDSHHLPILPKPVQSPPAFDTATDASAASTSAGNSKRGRKPGAMSRSARETQRKLNHSIIEKARRTKINEALSTLRQLIPSDFGSGSSTGRNKSKAADDDEDDDGELDEEYQEGKGKEKSKGKKEEKEFKLEILVRTVAYMQFLIQRVTDMEHELADGVPPAKCRSCQESSGLSTNRKRPRGSDIEVDVVEDNDLTSSSEHRSRRRKVDPPVNPSDSPNTLPSIASWLPSIAIDPSLLPPNAAGSSRSPQANPASKPSSPSLLSSPRFHAYLPSPPASTTFVPSTSYQVPPALSLPDASTLNSIPADANVGKRVVIDAAQNTKTRTSRSLSVTSSSTTVRTPEEESAASLLLQIRHSGTGSTASSPAFGPVSGTVATSTSPVLGFGTMRSPVFGPGAGSGYFSGSGDAFELGGGRREERDRRFISAKPGNNPAGADEGRRLVALTPSSMLGLKAQRDF